MGYLTDKEKSLLFSALKRETKVRKDSGLEEFVPVIKGLEEKFHYDRFEKEIRNAAVKEVSEELDFLRNWKAGVTNDFLKYDADSVEEIAEKARKQGIIEFASRLKHLIRINAKVSDRLVDCHYEVYESDIDEIAEELKSMRGSE